MPWDTQNPDSDKLVKPKFYPKPEIPKANSFSLGDFHDFDYCVFRFFVHHNLGKKYELAEGNFNQALGSVLDLTLKKVHQTKSYQEPLENLLMLIKAAEMDMREDVFKNGEKSFYGSQVKFLTPELINKTKEVFTKYYQGISGKFKPLIETDTTKRFRPFWKYPIKGDLPGGTVQIWGGPDAVEMGDDGIPEVVDYKYFEDNERGAGNLDMDLMPKVYMLLVAPELIKLGYKKGRFVVRFWQDPQKTGYYEEFDLNDLINLENFFKDKIGRMMRTESLSFCEKDFCKACKSPFRDNWVTELVLKGWIKNAPDIEASPDLPF